MNLERLFKLFLINAHKFKDKKKVLKFFKDEVELLALKKRKLKLGKIVFEIKETTFCGIVFTEEVDIRYVNQDNTDTDELKLENRLKAIAFKRDAKNFIALGVVIFGLLVFFYNTAYNWYLEHLPTLAYRPEHFDFIVNFSLNSIFNPYSFSHNIFIFLNHWLVEFICDFCIHFNVLF